MWNEICLTKNITSIRYCLSRITIHETTRAMHKISACYLGFKDYGQLREM